MKSKKRGIENQDDKEINCKPFIGERSPYWDYVRRFNRMNADGGLREAAQANPDILPDTEPQTTPEIDTKALMREAIQRAKLSKNEKNVLKYLGLQGFTEEKTAETLGISRRQVRVHFSRAQKKIEKIFVAILGDSGGIGRGDYE